MRVILDLYCGAGGSAVGYQRAGFHVVGVDSVPQIDYPGAMIVTDALAFLRTADLSRYAAIHASPPCQWSSAMTRGTNAGRRHLHSNLIPATRELLKLTGLPYVIENVQGAEVRRDLTLCGEMFGLGVIRHRYFECEGFDVTRPAHVPHRGRVRGWRHGTYYDGPYLAVYGDGGGKGTVAEWQAAMGLCHTDDRKAIAESIPPAYSEYVGRQLLESLET